MAVVEQRNPFEAYKPVEPAQDQNPFAGMANRELETERVPVYVVETGQTVEVSPSADATYIQRLAAEQRDAADNLFGYTKVPTASVTERFLKGAAGVGASLPSIAGGLMVEAGERGQARSTRSDMDRAKDFATTPPMDYGLEAVRTLTEFPAVNTFLQEKGKAIQRANMRWMQESGLMLDEADQDTLAAYIGAGAGSLAINLGLLYLTRNPAVTATTFGLMQKSSAYQELREAGLDPEKAGKISTVSGVVSGALEGIGDTILLKILTRPRGVVAKGIYSALENAVEEGAQTGLSEELILQLAGARNDDAMTIARRIAMSATAGGVTGGTAGTSIGAIQRIFQVDVPITATTDEIAQAIINSQIEANADAVAKDIGDNIDAEMHPDAKRTKNRDKVVAMFAALNNGTPIEKVYQTQEQKEAYIDSVMARVESLRRETKREKKLITRSASRALYADLDAVEAEIDALGAEYETLFEQGLAENEPAVQRVTGKIQAAQERRAKTMKRILDVEGPDAFAKESTGLIQEIQAAELEMAAIEEELAIAEKQAVSIPEEGAVAENNAVVIESLGAGTYTAKIDGKEVARANVADDGNANHLASINVDPSVRRTGIATKMLAFIENERGGKLDPSQSLTPDGAAWRAAIATKDLSKKQPTSVAIPTAPIAQLTERMAATQAKADTARTKLNEIRRAERNAKGGQKKIVVYHATQANIEKPSVKFAGKGGLADADSPHMALFMGEGAYFTATKEEAQGWADHIESLTGKPAQVKTLEISVSPENMIPESGPLPQEVIPKIRAALRKAGVSESDISDLNLDDYQSDLGTILIQFSRDGDKGADHIRRASRMFAEQGIDGVVLLGEDGAPKEYVVFKDENIHIPGQVVADSDRVITTAGQIRATMRDAAKTAIATAKAAFRAGTVSAKVEAKAVQRFVASLASIRGVDGKKFVRTIPNIQTFAQLESRLDEILTRVEASVTQTARKQQVAELDKTLDRVAESKSSGKRVGKYTAQLQESLFNPIADLAKRSGESVEDHAQRMAETAAKYRAIVAEGKGEPAAMAHAAIVADVATVMANRDSASPFTIADINDNLAQFIETGRNEHQAVVEARAAKIEENQKYVAKQAELVPAHEISEKEIFAKRRVRKYARAIFSAFLNDAHAFFTEMGLDDRFTKKLFRAQARRSTLNIKWQSAMRAAATRAFGLKDADLEAKFRDDNNVQIELNFGEPIAMTGDLTQRMAALSDKIDKTKNPEKQAELTEKLAELQAEYERRQKPYSEDNPHGAQKFSRTKGELRHLYMQFQDPALRAVYTSANGPYGFTEGLIQQIESMMTPADHRWMKELFQLYRDMHPDVNEVYARRYFTNLHRREDYVPIGREHDETREDGWDPILDEEYLRTTYAAWGNIKERTNNLNKIKRVSDIDTLGRYISEMAHWTSHVEVMDELTKTFRTNEMEARLKERFGSPFVNFFVRGLQDMANTIQDTDAFADVLDAWRGNYTVAALAITPQIMVKQFLTSIAMGERVNSAAFAANMAKHANPKHMRENWKLLQTHPVIRTRFEHLNIDIDRALKASEYRQWKENPKGWRDTMMAFIRWGDAGAVAMGGGALLDTLRAEGVPLEQALDEVARTIEETQQSSLPMNISFMQKHKYIRALMLFTSGPIAAQRRMVNAARQWKRGEISHAQLAKTVAIYQFLIPSLMQYVTDMFEWDEENQARAVLLGPWNAIFQLGGFIENLANEVFDADDYNDDPFFRRAMDDLMRDIKKLGKDDITFMEVMKALIDIAETPVEGFTGAPVGKAMERMEGGRRVLSGEEGGVKILLGWSPYKVDKELAESEEE